MENNFKLENKIAFVTGGSSEGYGNQIVDVLCEAGATVVISSRNEEKVKNKCKKLNGKGFKTIPSCFDLLDENQINNEIDRLHSLLGTFDILINNAVLHSENNFEDTEIEDWNNNNLDGVIATSAFGVGIDNENVRTVIHATVPETLDRFYQEVGRGGRDGKSSYSILCTIVSFCGILSIK